MTPEQRARQALKDFFTHADIPEHEQSDFAAQAREVAKQYGMDHCATWLEGYSTMAREQALAWAGRCADAEARINSRLSATYDPVAAQAFLVEIDKANAKAANSAAFVRPDSRGRQPRPPTGQERRQPALV